MGSKGSWLRTIQHGHPGNSQGGWFVMDAASAKSLKPSIKGHWSSWSHKAPPHEVTTPAQPPLSHCGLTGEGG